MKEKNLEDKINPKGNGDVTVELDLDSVVECLKEDLGISEESVGGTSDTNADTGKVSNRKSLWAGRNNQDNDYHYY